MSEAFLRLQYARDDDGTGKLRALVAAGHFAGCGEAYFSDGEIIRFANTLAQFPIPTDPRPQLASGFWKQDDAGGLNQEHVSISAYPIGVRGYVGLQIRLADESWPHDRPEQQRRIQVEVVTTYQPLARFSRQLLALAAGSTAEALLEGDLRPT